MNNNQEEKIVFHDEEVVQEKKGPVCKKAKLAFYGSIAYLIIVLMTDFIFEIQGTLLVVLGIIEVVCFFGSIILGAISLKEIKKKVLSGKIFAVLGIILPIVFLVLDIVFYIIINGDEFKKGLEQGFYCTQATQCVDNGNGTSTCQVNNEDFECPNEILNPSQYE